MEPKHPSSKRYPAELKDRAVCLVQELRLRDPGGYDRDLADRAAAGDRDQVAAAVGETGGGRGGPGTRGEE